VPQSRSIRHEGQKDRSTKVDPTFLWQSEGKVPNAHLKIAGYQRLSKESFVSAQELTLVLTARPMPMPLGVRIKSLMLIESIASFLIVGLLAARAVNILNM
jgi:hypothetical protein